MRRSGQQVPSSYSLPSLPLFLKKRRDHPPAPSPVAEVDFTFCISRFLQLLGDFSAGLPSYMEFRHKNHWSDQMVLLYLVLLLGTERRFVTDVEVLEAVTLLLHTQLDSFSTAHWCWGPTKKPDGAASRAAGFNHSSVCKTLVRMVNEFFPGEGGRQGVVCWAQKAGGAKVTDDTGTSDHHLNMVARLQLLPPSYRGHQVEQSNVWDEISPDACRSAGTCRTCTCRPWPASPTRFHTRSS